jgi:hypothetical protein
MRGVIRKILCVSPSRQVPVEFQTRSEGLRLRNRLQRLLKAGGYLGGTSPASRTEGACRTDGDVRDTGKSSKYEQEEVSDSNRVFLFRVMLTWARKGRNSPPASGQDVSWPPAFLSFSIGSAASSPWVAPRLVVGGHVIPGETMEAAGAFRSIKSNATPSGEGRTVPWVSCGPPRFGPAFVSGPFVFMPFGE